MRRPEEIVLACVLAAAYALVFLGVAAVLLWELVTGTGTIGQEQLVGRAAGGVASTALMLLLGGWLLASGAARLVRRRGRGLLVTPLLIFLAVGSIGEVVDLSGDATTLSDLIGGGILVLAAAPVLLTSTPRARRWARE